MAPRDGFLLRQARARPLASFAAAFLLGLLLARRLALPAPLCAAGLAVVLLCGVCLRKHRRAVSAMLLLAGLLAGMVRMEIAEGGLHALETRYSVAMTGRVASEPYRNPDTGRLIFKFDLETVEGEPFREYIRLYLRGDDEDALAAVDYGQRLQLTGHIWRPDPVTNPWEFDFEAYLQRQGLSGYATAKIEDVTALDTRRDIQSLVIAARRAISRRIDALFPQNAGLMRALVLGDRTLLGEELRESLNRTGTAHLISISGLHVTVLCALLALLLRRFMSRRKADLVAALLLIPYGALIGFTAPFVRALTMFGIFCLAPVAGLPSDALTRLCAVMLAWLLAKPLSVEDAGFALSYGASAGIILLRPPLMKLLGAWAPERRRPVDHRAARLWRAVRAYFPSLVCATVAAQLATLPAVVAFFGAQPVISLPFNLVCVPLCMLGYIAGLAALLISIPLMPLAMILAKGPDALFALLTAVTQLSAALPVSGLHIGRYPEGFAMLHWGLILAASELSRLKLRLRRWLPFATLAVAGLCCIVTFARCWGFSVTFLDAGQADSAIVRTRGHTYLFDAGDTYTPAADVLNATCLHLDGVVLSHPHQDHAGGLADVLTSFKPDAIYVPAGWFDAEDVSPAVTEGIDMAREMGVPIRELRAGDALALSKTAEMTVFAPVDGAEAHGINGLSMMALVTCEGRRVLFTGDLSVEDEPDAIPDCDVLKVAHHGSDKATSARFLAAATPRIAVISVGENNFDHPSAETLQKLEAAGAEVLLTRDCGAITLAPRGDGWRVETTLEATHELE